MYVVICTDNGVIDITNFQSDDELNHSIFGPFDSVNDAEEWVDNHCGRSYWTIVKLNT